MAKTELISIHRLKESAIKFPEPIHSLILEEQDKMTVEDFVSKIGLYEKIIELVKANREAKS